MQGSYEPFSGAITLDNLDDLFAHHRARFGDATMVEGDDDGEESVDDAADDGDDADEGDDAADDGDDGDEGDDEKNLGDAGKKALRAERLKVRDLRKQLRDAQTAATKKATKKDDDADEVDEEAITEKVTSAWKPRVVNASARAALVEAGGSNLKALLKLVEHDDLEVTDDGEVEGLDEEVDRLKEEYPELFAAKRRANGRVETGDRSKGSTKKPMTATERQAAALRGSAGK